MSIRNDFIQNIQDVLSKSVIDAANDINGWIYELIYSTDYVNEELNPSDLQLLLGIVTKACDDGTVYARIVGDVTSGKNAFELDTTKADLYKSEDGSIQLRPLAAVKSFVQPKIGDIIPVFMFKTIYTAFYLPAIPPDDFFANVGIDPTSNDILLLHLDNNRAIVTKFIYNRDSSQYELTFKNSTDTSITITSSAVIIKKTVDETEKAAKSKSLADHFNQTWKPILNSWKNIYNNHVHTNGAVTPAGNVVILPTPQPQIPADLSGIVESVFASNVLEIT